MKKTFFRLALAGILSIGVAWQAGSTNPLIGSLAPGFEAESTNGPIQFPEDFGRNWKILFAHPRDFTPVCSSELLELAYMQKEFDRMGAKIIVVSTDKLETHKSWKAALEEVHFKDRHPVKISFPLVDDQDYLVVEKYGMVHPEAKRGSNIRGVYFVDRENRIRAFQFYPVEVGRSTGEIIRTLAALQQTDDNVNVATPANWLPGEPVMVTYPTSLMEENLKSESPLYFRYNWFMTYLKIESEQE